MKPLSGVNYVPVLGIMFAYLHQICAAIETVPELIRFDGYPVEIHHAITEDGYVIELHRIPLGRFETKSTLKTKPVVLVGHCVFCSSASFVILVPSNSLAYILANEGYDVWLMNARGSSSSKSHLWIPPGDKTFWQFSWHEHGVYDLPASIDYALTVTGQSQLDYIGFSMGCTQYFVMMSEKPKYSHKIRSMTALAPAIYFESSLSIFGLAYDYRKGLLAYGELTGNQEIPPPELNIPQILAEKCKPQENINILCSKILYTVGGANNGNIDEKDLELIFKFFPESTSLNCFDHFLQIRKSGSFQKFNYGKEKNLRLYGIPKPPIYNLTGGTTPIYLYSAADDHISRPDGIEKLRSIVPNIVFDYEVPSTNFSHMDFVWGKNTTSLVYEVIVEKLQALRTTNQVNNLK